MSKEEIEKLAKEYSKGYRRATDFADGYADSFIAGAESQQKEIELLKIRFETMNFLFDGMSENFGRVSSQYDELSKKHDLLIQRLESK